MPLTNPQYLVRVLRHGHVMHGQITESLEDAESLKRVFEQAPSSEVEIVEVHDASETDLTTKTREIVESIASQATA